MTSIHSVRGDATQPQGGGPQIIAHVCNDEGGWGKGFVLALSRRYREPEAAFRRWAGGRATNGFGLGAVQMVSVAPQLWVANMVGQHGIARKGQVGPPPVRYTAIESVLAKVAEFAQQQDASVHRPRIGCGLAGGTWDKIEPLLERQLCARDVEVWVYDF